jgi:uncharacterized protein (DUF305 family)
MNTNSVLVALVALLIGGIGGYALSAQTNNHWGAGMMSQDTNTNGMMGMHRMPDGSMMSNDGGMGMGSMNGMDHMMDMMVSSEREFIEGMIPHHQEAVDTAKEVIARGGTTPEIKQLAEDIVFAQEAEIAQMKQWYQDWYGEEYADTGEYMPMMRDLSQLSGEALDRTFLEDMIMHHMGAIMMARSVQPYIEHSEIEKLTQAIVTTQSDEIRLMRQLLSGL